MVVKCIYDDKHHKFLNASTGLVGYALGIYTDGIITDQHYQAIRGFVKRMEECPKECQETLSTLRKIKEDKP